MRIVDKDASLCIYRCIDELVKIMLPGNLIKVNLSDEMVKNAFVFALPYLFHANGDGPFEFTQNEILLVLAYNKIEGSYLLLGGNGAIFAFAISNICYSHYIDSNKNCVYETWFDIF